MTIYAGSADLSWLTEMTFVGCYPAAGLAGILHCHQFFPADMDRGNVFCATKAAGHFVIDWIAEMAGVIGHGTAIFTCMTHNELLRVGAGPVAR